MERFTERHQNQILGVLSGFDRILFRGTLPSVCHRQALEYFLAGHSPLYKNFAAFAEGLSQRIKAHAQAYAEERQRPFQYLASAAASKEALASAIMKKDGITKGLICVFSCVEPCQSYAIRKDAKTKRLYLESAERKCLHLYFYFVDREFGLMHVRLQTWLPFQIQVCVNGREYLARRLERAGIGYEQRDNCFTRIDDLPRAQRLLDRLTTRKWAGFLNALARRLNPLLADPAYGFDRRGYYWTLRQSEYATDVMFRDAAALQALYPQLVHHAIQHLTCEDVLRFLGRRLDGRFVGEVTSDLRKRVEGVRVKHRVDENSIKMYDKQGSVLRIETTVNDPRRFRVRRPMTHQGRQVWRWAPMRKAVADIARRVEICRAANERYLQALAVVGQPQPVGPLFHHVSQRIVHQGRPYRSLRPLTEEETALFRAILRGEFLLQGFRNADLRRLLGSDTEADPQRRRQASGRITRLLRLLRAHRLIRKVTTTRYYRVTQKGHQLMTLALKLRETDLAQLAA